MLAGPGAMEHFRQLHMQQLMAARQAQQGACAWCAWCARCVWLVVSTLCVGSSCGRQLGRCCRRLLLSHPPVPSHHTSLCRHTRHTRHTHAQAPCPASSS
jgi:hypothetical protein